MVDQLNGIGGKWIPQVPGTGGSQPAQSSISQTGSFGQILGEEIQKQEPVQFSAHAQQRVQMRGISMTQQDLARLSQGVDQVAAKGGRESLVLMDQSAFVVSVPNRTVITAIDQSQIQNNVFTNIDSAIIV